MTKKKIDSLLKRAFKDAHKEQDILRSLKGRDLNPDEEPYFCGEGYYESGGWIAAHYSRLDGYHSKFVHPSMWMPLPSKPSVSGDEQL